MDEKIKIFNIQKNGISSKIEIDCNQEIHWTSKIINYFDYLYKLYENRNIYKLNQLKKYNYHLLSKDELLNLKVLKMCGLGLTSIPKEIGYLTNLEELDLSGNFMKELPDEIYGLHNLKILNLGSTWFGGNDIEYISVNIDRLVNLEMLYIVWNDNLKKLPDEILNLKELKYIFLSQNIIYISSVMDIIDKQYYPIVDFEEFNF